MRIRVSLILWILIIMVWHAVAFGQRLPKTYEARYADEKIHIDGKAESIWDQANWSDLFVDIEGEDHEKPVYETRIKVMWDEEGLYILCWMEEPHLWANLEERDAIIFYDNDFEVFVKPDLETEHYFEYEVNAKNTMMDLLMTKPYNQGGKALLSWDSKSLQHAVRLEGTLNDPDDIDMGWWVEMKIPYRDLLHFGGDIKPKTGRYWRINFSRVQWEVKVENGNYVKKKDVHGRDLPEKNWVWSPQYHINMHIPEYWGKVMFRKD